MTPVEMVQEWMTAIGETTHDAKHREALLWGALRRLQAAMNEWHQFDKDSNPNCEWFRASRINIARALCDVAYVAIGTALLQNHDWLDVYRLTEMESPSGWLTLTEKPNRVSVERNLYRLFYHPHESRPIRRAAAYYGFGDKLEDCFAEVHRANMAKLECCAECSDGWNRDNRLMYGVGYLRCKKCDGTGRAVRRTNAGRILKPAGWQPPDLGPILFGKMEDKTNG